MTSAISPSLSSVNDEQRSAAWQAAGLAVAAQITDGMTVGLGTGRSAAAAIRALGARVAEGLSCAGVPTSFGSEVLANEVGIEVAALRDDLDIAFDGADCVTRSGLIVKGAGGAMVRERLVAEAAKRFVVLVDETKLGETLDVWGLLPIAVLPFAADRVTKQLADLSPARRETPSDDGLILMDLCVPAGADWVEVADRAWSTPGVVDHGLFVVDPADVLVGYPDGARRLPDIV